MSVLSSLRVRAVAALAVAGVLLAGCTSATSSPAAQPSPAPASAGASETAVHYVALGDSYTAGPLINPGQPGSGSCLRSQHNYPSYVAEALHAASFVDVSCAAATVADLTHRQHVGGEQVPPQLAALSASTTLVTVGVGGNEEGLFGSLVDACLPQLTGQDTGPCPRIFPTRAALRERLAAARRVEGTLSSALQRIHRRAPQAEVLVVGYPRLLPRTGTCPAVPFAASDYAPLARVEAALNGSLRRAAAAEGATYVDLAGPSTGHDVCAGADAWVNGAQIQVGRAAPFHPFEAGMRGAADAVLAALGQG